MASIPDIACAATVDFDAAQHMLREDSGPIGTEFVPLAEAGLRILARNVVARIDSPRRDSAAMDGFAARSTDLSQGMARLRLCGESRAGGRAPPFLPPGCAIRISTGAPMPAGADRVVMREHACVEAGHVTLHNHSAKTNVRARASDFAQGQSLLAAGTRIDARNMVVAAAADVEGVMLWRRPRLHVLANGDELVSPGEAASRPDRIPDSLSQALMLMACQWGAEPAGASRSPDRMDELGKNSEAVLNNTDILVVVGGASHGRHDHARAALLPLGLKVRFAGVAMKPGKPLWYGRIGQSHVLGLPGNPTAALTTARLFLAPLIAAVAGAGFDDALRWSSHPVLHDIDDVGDRDHFLCGMMEAGGVRIIERQQASAQMLLAQADVLVERRSGAVFGKAGTMLRCIRF